MENMEEYRRNLPHIQPEGAMFFVTFRLYKSISVKQLEILSEQYELAMSVVQNRFDNNNIQEDYFDSLDSILDANNSKINYLAINSVAQLVYDSIIHFDSKKYKLVCFCIMPNHVHMIIYKLTKPLHLVLKDLKSYTGKEAFKILHNINLRRLDKLNIQKKFWQAESFDRIIRDKMDMATKISYVLNNPVKAGLVGDWKNWKWSYCRSEFKPE